MLKSLRSLVQVLVKCEKTIERMIMGKKSVQNQITKTIKIDKMKVSFVRKDIKNLGEKKRHS